MKTKKSFQDQEMEYEISIS